MQTNASIESALLETQALRVVAELQSLLDSARDHSFVVERAVERFSGLSDVDSTPSVEDYSRWLTPLGESLRSSICRQLEVEGYFKRQSWFRTIGDVVDWPAAGERVGPFQLMEQVGQGAQSRVFLCRQAGVGDRQVIVKFTRSSLLEADVLGRLRHPNIVPIYSAASDEQAGISHLCMPFLGRSTLNDLIGVDAHESARGGDLLARVADQSRKPSDAVGDEDVSAPHPRFYDRHDGVAWIGWRLANALAHAHDQGIFHGDVKPSNVLLAWDGTPLLMDFNLSGSLAHAVEAKGGTLPYMPPEQLQSVGLERGDAAYDQRSDLFSLGVLLYELLAGRLPFPLSKSSGDRRVLATELLEQQRRGAAQLHSWDRSIPPGLAAAVERCISFDPRQRYQSAASLALDLGARFSAQGNAKRFVRRYRWPLAVASLVVGASLAGFGVAAATRPAEELQLFQTGVESLNNGDNSASLVALDRSLALRPDNDEARFAFGVALTRTEEYGRAESCFNALFRREKSGRAAAYAAYCASKIRNAGGSIPWCELALEHGGDCPEVRNNLAIAYEAGPSRLGPKGRLFEAQSHLALAREALPTSPTIRYNWLHLQVSLADTAATMISHDDAILARELAEEFPDDWFVQLLAARVLCLRSAVDPALQDATLDCLERAVARGCHVSDVDATWNPLKESPRFASIVAKSRERAVRPAPKSVIPRSLEPTSLLKINAENE